MKRQPEKTRLISSRSVLAGLLLGLLGAATLAGVMRIGSECRPRPRAVATRQRLEGARVGRTIARPVVSGRAGAARRTLGRSAHRLPAPLQAAAVTAPVPETWSQRVFADIEAREYHATDTGAGLQAPNRSQGLRIRFGATQVRVEPRVHGNEWAWEWSTLAWGHDRALHDVTATAPVASGARVTYDHGGLHEWYENRPAGIEQGFVVAERPAGMGELTIDGTAGGTLAVAWDPDSHRFEFRDRNGALALCYGGLAAVDARGRSLPASLSLDGSVVRIAVDDRAAAYPVTIDPIIAAAAWTVEGTQDSSHFGAVVATAGDVDHDGFSDVVVGAPDYDGGHYNDGAAYVFMGSSAGLSQTPSWTQSGTRANAHFGAAAACAGDVNGDGYDEIIVGAPGFDDGTHRGGAAYLYMGSGSGLATSPGWTVLATQLGAGYGGSVATAGDVNGDRYADVIVGASLSDSLSFTDEGEAYVYLGSSAGLAPAPQWMGKALQANAYFGASVCTAGDVNGDGYADVVVGAPQYDESNGHAGAAFVYLGSPAGVSASAATTLAVSTSSHFGQSVATAGDVDGDGYCEVVVGAPGGVAVDAYAFLFKGSASGLATAPAWTNSYGPDGAAVAPAGDVNGDGYADVIVGAPTVQSGSNTNAGEVWVYEGSATGLNTDPVWVAFGAEAGERFGASVATAGDVNGDGFSDIIVGSPGHAVCEGVGCPSALLGSAPRSGTMNVSTLMQTARIAPASPADSRPSAQSVPTIAPASAVPDPAHSTCPSTVTLSPNGGNECCFTVIVRDVTGSPINGSTVVVDLSACSVTFCPGQPPGITVNAAAKTVTATTNASGQATFCICACLAASCTATISADGVALCNRPAQNCASCPTAPACQVSPAPISFGSVPVGSSADRTLTIQNTGGGTLTGTVTESCAEFSIVGAASYSLGAGQSAPITVRFTPASTGAKTCLIHTGTSCPADTAVGTGTSAPMCQVSPSPIDFGSVPVGGSVDRTLTIQNTGGGTLSGNVTESCPAFSLIGTTSYSLTAGQSASITVRFTPTSAGPQQCALATGTSCLADTAVGTGVLFHRDAGSAALFLGAPAGLASTPGWTLERHHVGAQLGFSVASAHDVNGDGYGDLIVGAPLWDGGGSEAGIAFIYLGGPLGPAATPWDSVTVGQAGAHVGWSVAGLGDVNGDGYGDVVIGAPLWDGTAVDQGLALVRFGGRQHLASPSGGSITLAQAGAHAGWSVAGAGDVRGSGYPGILVGAPGYSGAHVSEGAVLFVAGGGTLAAPTLIDPGTSAQDSAQFGYSVASAGRVDSLSDPSVGDFIIIGAPFHDTPLVNAGRASVFGATADGFSERWAATGSTAGSQFGIAVASAGDVNGDGLRDVIVGADRYSSGLLDRGAAYVYLGADSGLSASPAWTRIGSVAGGRFGGFVATMDLNSDGYSDVLVGQRGDAPVNCNVPAVLAYPGSAAGLSATTIWSACLAGASQGVAIGAGGDVNGDGFPDLAIGTPQLTNGQASEGGVSLFYGGGGRGLARCARVVRSDTTTVDVGSQTDGSSCFYVAMLVRGPAGIQDAHLESRSWTAPSSLDTNQCCSTCGCGSGIGGGGTSGVDSLSVPRLSHDCNLPAMQPFRYKIRLVQHSPFFPHSPWISSPYVATTAVMLRSQSVAGVEPGVDAIARGLRFAAPWPNPTHGSVILDFTLPVPGPARLVIRDVTGRRVARVLDAWQTAGRHLLTWDGVDAHGHVVPPGAYYASLTLRGERRTQKIMKLE